MSRANFLITSRVHYSPSLSESRAVSSKLNRETLCLLVMVHGVSSSFYVLVYSVLNKIVILYLFIRVMLVFIYF